MKSESRWISPARWVLLSLAGAAACNAIAGIEDPVVVRPQGESCILNSDCDDPMQVCLFETCSPPCDEDIDCERGEYCLRTTDGVGCVPTGRASCRNGETCPAGSACFDGECRTDCRGNPSVCLSDQTCDSDGACRGNGGGGTGGASGTGGSAGASTGGSGPGGEGGGGEAGGGGSGGTGGTGTSGDPCEDEGAFQCTGNASPGRLVCEGEVWVTGAPCGNGELCDTASDAAGECVMVPDECRGRTPGAAFCEGLTRVICGPDLVTTERTDCETIQHCTLASGPECAACLPNEYRCTGEVLEICNDERTGFDEVETCMGEPCNAEAGACTTFACVTVGQRRCEGDRLEACNAQRDGYDLVETCDPGMCDPEALECDVCVPETLTCADDATQRECDEDGQGYTNTACQASTSICTGAGQCVGCTRAEDCTPPTPCYMRACNTGNGQCEFARFATHQPCSGGYCTAAGECVDCTRPEQCETSGECFAAVCTNQNVCDEDPRGTSETCSGGYCNGSGTCVRCNNAGQCPDPGECRIPTCTGSPPACGQQQEPVRTPCSGGLCSANGACVACLVDGDCTQPSNPCQLTTCAGNSCTPGFTPAPMPCNGGPGWVCNGMGTCVDCVTATQCGMNEVCHGNACTAAEHTVGNASVDAGTSMAFAGSVLVCRLPPLQYPAQLLTFGVAGNASGLTARAVLYADSGGFPSGMPLAVNAGQNFPLIGGTLSEPQPDNMRMLSAGQVYWVGVATSADTLLRGQANGSATCRVWAQNYQQPFGAAQMGNPNNGFEFNLAIRVRDTQ